MKPHVGVLVLVIICIGDIDAQGPPRFGGRGRPPVGRRPGPPPVGGKHGPGGPNGGQRFITKETVACLKSCNARNLACDLLPINKMTPQCRSCLRAQCPDSAAEPGFVTERCEISKYTTCSNSSSCPSYTQSDQIFLSQCLKCRDRCISSEMKDNITKKMKEAAACKDKCSKTHGCPTEQPSSCIECLQKACGYERHTAAHNNCAQRVIASRTCQTCTVLTYDVPSLATRNSCQRCMGACVSGSEPKENRHDEEDLRSAFVRFLPKTAILCLTSKCSICKSIDESDDKISNQPEACKTCMAARCPKSPTTAGFDSFDCMHDAYDSCVIQKICPLMTPEESSLCSQCIACRNGCLTDDIKKVVRKKLAAAQDDRRPGRGGRHDDDRRPGRGRPGFGNYGDGDRRNGRPGGNDGSSRGGLSGRGQPGSGRGGRGRGDGRTSRFSDAKDSAYLPAQSLACLGTNCQSKCSQARRDTWEINASCRHCIAAMCSFDEGVPNFDDAKCRYDARPQCGIMFGCNALEPAVQANRTACNSCVNTCLPESVKIQVRIRMKNAVMCKEMCEKNSCSHRGMCRECIDKGCENSQVRDCEFNARRSSTTCPVCSYTTDNEKKCEDCMKACMPVPSSGGPAPPPPGTGSSTGNPGSMSGSMALGKCYKTCQSRGCHKDDETCINCVKAGCENSLYANCESIIREACPTCSKKAMTTTNQDPNIPIFCKQCFATCDSKHGSDVTQG